MTRRRIDSRSPVQSMNEIEPPVIGVLALQGAFEAHEIALRKLGAVTRRVRSRADLAGLDGIVLPGGESTTMSNLLVATELFAPLRSALDSGLPVLGTCAGMILLADGIEDGRDDQVSFGTMDMCVRRNAYGRQIDSFETEIAIEGKDRKVPAIFIRAPAIESMGEHVSVLARHCGSPCLVRQGNALASSFHPELTNDDVVHRMFLRIVEEHRSHSLSTRGEGAVGASRNEE